MALASDLETYGDAHPSVAIRRNNLGSAWHSLREYPKAIEYYELALMVSISVHGPDHPNINIMRNNLKNAQVKITDLATLE